MLLDRSPEAYGRTKGWHSSQAVSAENRPSKAKGDKPSTAFEVFEVRRATLRLDSNTPLTDPFPSFL